jgi:hypothetical protein
MLYIVFTIYFLGILGVAVTCLSWLGGWLGWPWHLGALGADAMWRIMEAPPFGPYLDRSCCMCFFHMLTFTVRCVSCIFIYFHVLIRCRMFEMLLHCLFPWKRSMFSGCPIIFCMFFFSMETNSPPEILFPWHDRWHELWAVGNLALPHLRYYIYIIIMYKYYKSVQNFKAQVYLCIYTWHVGRLELWSFRRSGFGTCSMGRVAQPRLGGLGHGAYGWVQPWEWPHMLGYKPSKYIQIYIYI